MRFYKEVWGIIWEFNSIGEFISFTLGRVLGAIISSVDCIYYASVVDYEDLRITNKVPIQAIQQRLLWQHTANAIH